LENCKKALKLNYYAENYLHQPEQPGIRNLNYDVALHTVEKKNPSSKERIAYSHAASYFLAYYRNYYLHAVN
jgi:hypothetical protein